MLCGVTDLALTREEDEDVAAALGPQLLDRQPDAGHLVAVVLGVAPAERPVADLDRVGAAGDLDDRRRRAVAGEVPGEPLGVDRRRGDDELEVGPARQQLLEVAEEEVDVEAALVRLVDDDRVVAAQVAVALQLGQQDAVGHHLDQRVAGGVVGEPDLVADRLAELGVELLGDPLGHRPGGDPPGLGVPDGALDAPAELEADLGDLGGLPRPGLPRHDDHLVVADGGGDVLAPLDDRQVLGVGDGRHQGAAPRHTGLTHLGRLARAGRATAGGAAAPAPGARGLRRALGGHALKDRRSGATPSTEFRRRRLSCGAASPPAGGSGPAGRGRS